MFSHTREQSAFKQLGFYRYVVFGVPQKHSVVGSPYNFLFSLCLTSSLSTSLKEMRMVCTIIRFWGSTTGLLCALLLQNCQLNSVRATEEEGLAASSSASSTHQHTSSESLAVRSSLLDPLSDSPAACVALARFSTLSVHEGALSIASFFPALILSAPSTRATMGNSPTASYDPSAVAMPRDSHAVPQSDQAGHAPSLVFTTAFGEHVEVSQIDGQWHAAIQAGGGTFTLQRILPVAGTTDVNSFLSWLQSQDQLTSRGCIHILKMPQSLHNSCVYLGRTGLLEGGPALLSQGARQESRMAFGAKEWQRYFGEVGPAPDLPSDIDAILGAPCPFWGGSTVRDTHLLVLIPATVDGVPFTLSLLGDLIRRPKNDGYETTYRFYHNKVKSQIGAACLQASYWLLMTHDVLPESNGKNYSDQKELIAGHVNRTGLPYKLPKVLEAATAILTHHARYGERLYSESNDLLPYTCCQELIFCKSSKYPAVVGGFKSSGFDVFIRYGRRNYGVAGCRNF